MIRVEFLQDICGIPKGTIREWKDNHSGLVRDQVAAGKIRVLPNEPEKVERLEPKQPEKVKTNLPPKTLKAKRK